MISLDSTEPPLENFRAPIAIDVVSEKTMTVTLNKASGLNGPILHYNLVVVPKDLYAKATKPQHIHEEDVSIVHKILRIIFTFL